MRDGGSSFMTSPKLRLSQVDTVAVYCPVPEQSVAVIDVQISGTFGKQLPNPGDFFYILGNMGLAASSCAGVLVGAKRGVMA